MLKIYCQKCGGLNGYVSEKPNFCQKCGGIFGHAPQDELIMNEVEQVSSASLEETDSSEHGNIPDISQLDIEIDIRGPNTSVVGELAGKNFNTGAPEDKSENINNAEDYDGWEVFQKEASAIKPNEKGQEET